VTAGVLWVMVKISRRPVSPPAGADKRRPHSGQHKHNKHFYFYTEA
jgi:hypothetical protein